jgi:hypothetical protein
VRIERFLSLEDPLRSEGKRFLVVSISPGNIEPLYYSKHPNEWIFLLPSVPNSASITELNLGQYYPRQFWEFSDLRKHASQVALIDPNPDLSDELGRAGLKLTIRLSKPVKVVYIQ